jgi:hypothetical protein
MTLNMGAHLEPQLRRLVGRIDDPQVVADLVLHRLAEKVRLYKNLGLYAWDGTNWQVVIKGPIGKWTREMSRVFVQAYLLPEIKEIANLLNELGFGSESCSLREQMANEQWVSWVEIWVLWPELMKRKKAPVKKEADKEFVDIIYAHRYLPVMNGAVNLANYKIHEYSDLKDVFFPHILKLHYNPLYFSSDFSELVDLWAGGSMRKREYIKWALGAAFTGALEDKNIFVLYCKDLEYINLLLQILAFILEDYATQIPHWVIQTPNAITDNLLEQINCKRMVCVLGFPGDGVIDWEVLSWLSKCGPIGISEKGIHHEDSYYTFSVANWFITTDKMPRIKGDLQDFLARVNIVPLGKMQPAPKISPEKFYKALLEARLGVLSSVLDGAVAYLRSIYSQSHKTIVPDDVEKVRNMWKEENKKPLPTRKGQTQNKNRL